MKIEKLEECSREKYTCFAHENTYIVCELGQNWHFFYWKWNSNHVVCKKEQLNRPLARSIMFRIIRLQSALGSSSKWSSLFKLEQIIREINRISFKHEHFLRRLSHTFRLVPNFHWIVVEDADYHTSLVANLLKSSRLNYTHLIAPTPASWKRKLRVKFANLILDFRHHSVSSIWPKISVFRNRNGRNRGEYRSEIPPYDGYEIPKTRIPIEESCISQTMIIRTVWNCFMK